MRGARGADSDDDVDTTLFGAARKRAFEL
jgi:hypothetical protein